MVLPLALCSGETPLGELCPSRESSVQEGQLPVGAGVEKSYKNYQRAGAPLLRGKYERVGVVQTVEVSGDISLQCFSASRGRGLSP